MEPGLIEKHLLVRHLPESPDLLFLPLWRKDVLLHSQHKHVLEMGSFGIAAAGLPLADGAAGRSGVLRVIGLPEGKVLASWSAHDDTIFGLDFSRDGAQLVTAGGDRNSWPGECPM